MAVSAETLVSHLEFLMAERVGTLTPDQLRFLDIAARQGQRLLETLGDLRLVALAARDRVELEWSCCDLGQMARAAVERVCPVAYAHRKPIDLTIEGSTRLIADRPRVERALIGLLEHAVEHGVVGSGITLSVEDRTVELSFAGEQPGDESLGVVLADSVAALHGGQLTVGAADGRVTVSLSLVAAESADVDAALELVA